MGLGANGSPAILLGGYTIQARWAGGLPLTRDEFTAALGAWEGYRVVACQRLEADTQEGRKRPVVVIELEPDPGRVKRCGGCGEEVDRVHDVTERRVRDLPILDADTQLVVPRCRLDCPRCGPKLERLDWLARYSRVTRRLAESVARLCKVLPVRHVADYPGPGLGRGQADRQGVPGADLWPGGPQRGRGDRHGRVRDPEGASLRNRDR